jgi:hypothetical protein
VAELAAVRMLVRMMQPGVKLVLFHRHRLSEAR